MSVAAPCRVADVVVTVVAEGDIDHATLCETLHISEVVLQCETVLDGKHNGLATTPFVFVEISRSTCNAQVIAVVADDVFYLVEDTVGIGER